MTRTNGGPLNYRVLDLTDARGLMAGHLLARLGADVVQVELPGGSAARSAGPLGGSGADGLFWVAYAAGKRAITLDYRRSDGRARLLDLVRHADLLIETADPGELAGFGLDRAALRAANPRLVHVTITAFGSTGPKAGWAATDLTVWASSGAVWPHRGQDGVPLRISVPQAFLQASIDAVGGALIALAARDAGAPGQHVDVSAQASCMLCTLSSHLASSVNHRDFNALGGVQSKALLDLSGSGARTRKTKWQVRDGLVEMHIGMGPAAGRYANALFAWLADRGDCPVDLAAIDWVAVPERLTSGELTAADLNRARAYTADVLATYTKVEILAIAQQRGLMMAPVMTTADLMASEHLAARGAFRRYGEGSRAVLLPDPFPACGFEAETWRPAPLPGEHQDEVMRDWSRDAGATAQPAEAAGRAATTPALAGLKVVDLAWVVAGPLIGRALADFGATVVRVESGRRLCTARLMGPFPDGRFDPQMSLLFENGNANKLGLTLDLGTEEARGVVRDLVAWGDVLIESFMPGQMAKFGLDYAKLRAINPKLVMVSSSLMGATGPNAQFAGFGNVGGALSGFQQIVGLRDELPVGPFGPYTDYVAPRFGLMALLAAVERQRRTGEGCHLDLAQVEGAVAMLAPQLLDVQVDGRIAMPQGNRDAAMVPSGIFAAAGDDRWIAIAAGTDAEWRRLARLIGGEPLANDPRFATLAARRLNENALETILGAWARAREAHAIEAMLQAEHVPAHVVAASDDILADGQLAARGQVVRLPHDRAGETLFDAARYQLDATPAAYRRTAPYHGRDNRFVLADLLGYVPERIAQLHAAGAIA